MHSNQGRSGRGAGLPDSVGLWLVVGAFGVVMMGTTLPTPLYVIYQREFGFSTLLVTIIFAVYGAGVVLALLVCGHVSDQIGRRRTLLPGIGLSALSSLVFVLAHELWPLFPARLLSGLSAGMVAGTATAAVVDLGAALGAARATVLATVTQVVGLGLGPLVGGLLAEYAPAPLRLPYLVDLGLLALAAVGVWAMPEPVHPLAARPRLRLAVPRVPAPIRGLFLRAATAGFAGFAVLGLFTAVAPSFLRVLLGLHSLTLAGGVICAVFCASGAGQVLLVPLAGRHSLPIGCAGLIAGMAWLIAGFAAEDFAFMLVGGLLAGVGQGMSFRAGLAAVNAQAPADRRADIASIYFVILYVALAVPVIGVGLAAELMGLRDAGILFSAAVALLAAGSLTAVLRTHDTANGG